MIDIDAIDHRQLYAQLLHEVETGQRYYFTKDEEQEMQHRNERYYKPDAVELLFTEFFRAATDADSPDSVLLRSAGQLMDSLSHRRPSLLRLVSETSFGTMLRRLSIPREHHHSGNVYRVVAL
jgi:hypothetical protein